MDEFYGCTISDCTGRPIFKGIGPFEFDDVSQNYTLRPGIYVLREPLIVRRAAETRFVGITYYGNETNRDVCPWCEANLPLERKLADLATSAQASSIVALVMFGIGALMPAWRVLAWGASGAVGFSAVIDLVRAYRLSAPTRRRQP